MPPARTPSMRPKSCSNLLGRGGDSPASPPACSITAATNHQRSAEDQRCQWLPSSMPLPTRLSTVQRSTNICVTFTVAAELRAADGVRPTILRSHCSLRPSTRRSTPIPQEGVACTVNRLTPVRRGDPRDEVRRRPVPTGRHGRFESGAALSETDSATCNPLGGSSG